MWNNIISFYIFFKKIEKPWQNLCDLETLWRPSCYVMFSTPSEVETWLNYPRNTRVFIKKQPRIRNFNKLLASTKAHCQGCKIDWSVDIGQTKQPSLNMSNRLINYLLSNLTNYLVSYLCNIGLLCSLFISLGLLG